MPLIPENHTLRLVEQPCPCRSVVLISRPVIALVVAIIFTGSAVEADDNERKSSLSVFCLAYADGLRSLFFRSGPDEYQAIELSTANVVEAGVTQVENGRILLRGPADGNGGHPVVASVDVSGIRQPLVILYPAASDAAHPYESIAVEAEPGKFPLGSFNLVNLSPHAVRINHDNRVIELQTGEASVFVPDHAAGDSLSMTMDYRNGENWQLLSSAR